MNQRVYPDGLTAPLPAAHGAVPERGYHPAMPLPAWLGRFNRSVTNRVTGLFAGRVPGFAVLMHVGRRSGRTYRTPVNIFRSGTGYVIALTYGPDTDWVRNVLAAGGCVAQTRASAVRLRDPRIVSDPQVRLVPTPIRPILRLANVTEFMQLKTDSGAD
jgi:deazaflavin-dependent oxidoreductase (nitroreductase family)